MSEFQLWAQYSSASPAPAFLILCFLCVLAILGSLWLWKFRGQNFHLLFILSVVSLIPLAMTSALDAWTAREFSHQEISTLSIQDGMLHFALKYQNLSYRSSASSHYSLDITDNETNSANVVLHLANGPSFRIAQINPEQDAFEKIQKKLLLDLPIIYQGLVLNAQSGQLIRTRYNPFHAAREARPLESIDLKGLSFPSASQQEMIGTDLRILYESVDLYWSDLSFYWLLVCLFITFSVFALRAISSRGMRLDPTMWLALGITPLLWYLFPTFHSSEIELKLDSQKLRYIKGTKARILDLADVRYVECKTPGTGIAIYKEDPEAIAWSEIANLYPPGPLEPDKNMHPLKLAGVGFRTGGAALRLFHESVRIDTGNLTAVERVILCDALGNLARKARQRFSFYE